MIIFIRKKREREDSKANKSGLVGDRGAHNLSGFVVFHHSSPKISRSHRGNACLDGFSEFVSITQFSPK